MKLNIRELKLEDHQKAMELHAAMNLDYELKIDGPDMLVRNGMFDENKLVAVCLARATTEGYLFLDKGWGTPQDRLDVSRRIIYASAAETRLYGMQDTHIWLPPKANCFMKRLKKMGFVQAPWPCMTVRV